MEFPSGQISMDKLYVFNRGYIESCLLEEVCRVLDVRLVMRDMVYVWAILDTQTIPPNF